MLLQIFCIMAPCCNNNQEYTAAYKPGVYLPTCFIAWLRWHHQYQTKQLWTAISLAFFYAKETYWSTTNATEAYWPRTISFVDFIFDGIQFILLSTLIIIVIICIFLEHHWRTTNHLIFDRYSISLPQLIGSGHQLSNSTMVNLQSLYRVATHNINVDVDAPLHHVVAFMLQQLATKLLHRAPALVATIYYFGSHIAAATAAAADAFLLNAEETYWYEGTMRQDDRMLLHLCLHCFFLIGFIGVSTPTQSTSNPPSPTTSDEVYCSTNFHLDFNMTSQYPKTTCIVTYSSLRATMMDSLRSMFLVDSTHRTSSIVSLVHATTHFVDNMLHPALLILHRTVAVWISNTMQQDSTLLTLITKILPGTLAFALSPHMLQCMSQASSSLSTTLNNVQTWLSIFYTEEAYWSATTNTEEAYWISLLSYVCLPQCYVSQCYIHVPSILLALTTIFDYSSTRLASLFDLAPLFVLSYLSKHDSIGGCWTPVPLLSPVTSPLP